MTASRLVLAIALAASLPPAFAEGTGDAWRDGDVKQGETLVKRDCIACHARSFDGDASRIYLRAERKVRTPAQLVAQVSYCNTQLGTGYFPDEEAHVAAYLNAQYYHFP
jgi:mono/diheme cytochrome c family protein